MLGLNLDNLDRYRDEILKAEIGALLFNLGKSHIGFWKKKKDIEYFNVNDNTFKDVFGFKPFESYKDYYNRNSALNGISFFEYELDMFSLKDFIINNKVRFPFKIKKSDNQEENEIDWIEIFKGDSSNVEFIKKVFFRGCENINSGIDKGFPNVQLKPPLWLSNAFGSFKEKIDKYNFDEKRRCFYSNLASFLSSRGYFQNPNWQEIRNYILNEIKEWYFHLLSDSRFPINDITLFDQAYMTASMFKAVLAQLVLDSSKLGTYQNNPSSIKWRILGIQYDKIGIAEKSLKLASISWYRNVTREIDEEIKKLLEVEYPIGNEIYRDETGIYFIVGEDLGKDLDDGSNLAVFKLKGLEDKILEIFKEKTKDEFYPAIFLTKASRGLMNLSYLLEKAKENFLKVNWKQKDLNLWLIGTIKGKAIGICPLCQTRLIYEKDKEKRNQPTICEVCDNRIHHKQVEKWIKDLNGETIWIDEIKDKNNRVAYVSLKFELRDWLNGNLLNSLLGRKDNFFKNFNKIKLFIKLLIINKTDFLDKKISELDKQISELDKKLKDKTLSKKLKQNLGRQKGSLTSVKKELGKIKDIINILIQEKWWDKPLDKEYSLKGYSNWDIDNYIEEIGTVLKKHFSDLEFGNPFNNLAYDAYAGCKRNKESFNDFIKQIFFGSIIGTVWEDWIKQTPLNSKIDWEEEKIKWKEFTDKDDSALNLLTTLLLQFLLRKNPSPARLRRIWETTQGFFEDIYNNLESVLNIPDWRKKRLVWKVENDSLKDKKSMELEANGVLFWMEKEGNTWEEKINSNKAKIYLISSISDFIDIYGNKQLKELKNKSLKNDEEAIKELNNILSSKESLKNYLQEYKINLKECETEKQIIEIDIKSNLKEVHTYKPFTSIIDPSPINYQIVIPAEYLPNLIDEVISRYNKEFKYVYGKLPIHIGIIISDYKKPVYINLKALRKIRRDIKDMEKLNSFPKVGIFKKLYFSKFLKECNFLQINNNIEQIEKSIVNNNGEIEDIDEKVSIEIKNGTYHYYSLYWNNPNNRDYKFYIKPKNNWQKWISTIDKFNINSEVHIIPNTFDFEYLDHNIRRNEIFYDEKGKRVIPTKQNRPYELEVYWEKFKKFKELFTETHLNSTRLHKLVEILYSKLQKEEDYNSDYSYLLTSSFIELLELNKKGEEYSKRRQIINDIFDLEINGFEELSKDFKEKLQRKLTQQENIYLFLDMFEFWHTAMKEV